MSLTPDNAESPLLLIRMNGEEICRVDKGSLPCEKQPNAYTSPGGKVDFIDSHGISHSHELGNISGWVHFSIRIHASLACQADCVITQSEIFDPAAFGQGKATGIRFQPFFLTGANVQNQEFKGKGLFARGLHFNGTVTNGNTLLSCECDSCHRPFLIHSYHAGFSNLGYFYSGSGQYTITVSSHVPGCPAALTVPDPVELASLEAMLPKAPDGSEYRYLNPFRCPHCKEPFINFESHPSERTAEYYGNYFQGSELLRYEPSRG